MPRWSRWFQGCVLVVIAAGGPGCSCAKPSLQPKYAATAPGAPTDHLVLLRAVRNGAGGTARTNRELYKPFIVEARIARYDPAGASGGDGTIGISVLENFGVGKFFILETTRSGDGILVEAGTGASVVNSETFDGTDAVELQIEMKSPLATFRARRPGEANWTDVGVATAGGAGPYQMSFDVFDLPKNLKFGVDLVRVVQNSAPASPTDLQTAREEAWRAIDALLEAGYALDGASPDRETSAGHVDDAVALFDAAADGAPSGQKAALAKLKSAGKKAKSLASKIRGRKPPKSLLASLKGVLSVAGQGVERLR